MLEAALKIPSSYVLAPVWWKGKIKGYRHCNNPSFEKQKEELFITVRKLRENKSICDRCQKNSSCSNKEKVMSLDFVDFLNHVCPQIEKQS